MHQHQQQQRLQQAMFARRQQEANLLFHQYNQLRSMQAAYSNPALSSMTYAQQPIDSQQQQQLYRTDQLVSQTPTPVQPQMQSSSPVQMLSISAPETWLTGSPLPQNPDMFHPISHTLSLTMLDMLPYHNRTNSISSEPSSPLMNASFDSPKSAHRYYSNYQQSSPENHRRRERLHSGSSCYESDRSDLSGDDEEFGVRENFVFNGA
jgi:hypothetical protein